MLIQYFSAFHTLRGCHASSSGATDPGRLPCRSRLQNCYVCGLSRSCSVLCCVLTFLNSGITAATRLSDFDEIIDFKSQKLSSTTELGAQPLQNHREKLNSNFLPWRKSCHVIQWWILGTPWQRHTRSRSSESSKLKHQQTLFSICMLWEFCVHMGCMIVPSKISIDLSFSLSCYMRPVLG